MKAETPFYDENGIAHDPYVKKLEQQITDLEKKFELLLKALGVSIDETQGKK